MSKQSLIDDIQDVLSKYADVDPEQFVPSMRQMMADFAELDTNGRSRVEPERSEAEFAGERCVIARGGDVDNTDVILYMHGGGFVAGSPETHVGLTNQLAHLSRKNVIVVDYPRLPEVSGTQMIDALVNVYSAVAAGFSPQASIFLAGDSAGGFLALSLAQQVQKHDLKKPSAIATLSAVVDLTLSGDSYTANAEREIMLSADMLGALYAMYLGVNEAKNPAHSPLHSNLSDFPPLLMQVGGDEILRDDSAMMVDAVKAAGGDAKLEVWPDLFHVWHAFPSRIPEAVQALTNVARFFARYQ